MEKMHVVEGGRDMNDWKEEEEVEKVDKGNRKREDTLLDD